MLLKNYLPSIGSIYGVGTDLVVVTRITKLWNKYGLRFAKKILNKVELAFLENSKKPELFLAKKFAAKEAVVKALGTGFNFGVYITQIAITNNKFGQPQVEYFGDTKNFIRNNIGDITTHVSISDEENLALAFVVITKIT